MDVSDADIAAIPSENVHVPSGEFVAVWRTAEAEAKTDWYAVGVAATCRWLAAATVRPESQPWHVAPAPASRRTARRALPELIEQECLEADVLASRIPQPVWLSDRPGWLEGVRATFDWAWRRAGPAPFTVDDAAS